MMTMYISILDLSFYTKNKINNNDNNNVIITKKMTSIIPKSHMQKEVAKPHSVIKIIQYIFVGVQLSNVFG